MQKNGNLEDEVGGEGDKTKLCPLFFYNCMSVSYFPSLTHQPLSFSKAHFLSLMMSKRDHLLNSMGKLRLGSEKLGFDTVNEDK